MDDLEKALEEIVRNFLLHETIIKSKPETREKGNRVEEDESNKSVQLPEIPVSDDEFIANLYDCLSERGVLREVHSLLRQRLVEILKGTFPKVVTSGCTSNVNPVVVKLLEDFLCCHKFLFTYSVFATELGGKDHSNSNFKKLTSFDAEELLEDVGIRKNSTMSLNVLKQYANNHISLLECIISTPLLSNKVESEQLQPCRDTDSIDVEESLFPLGASSKRIKFVGEDEHSSGVFRVSNTTDSKLESIDHKFFQLQLSMERDKEAQLKIAMQRFREEETAKIRDEIEARLKFEFLAKERELLRNYDDRVAHMKSLLDREKEIWMEEKSRKEKELFSQRQDLVRLMEHVKEKKMKLKEALQKSERQNPNESVCSDRFEKNRMEVSVRSDDTETSSESDRKVNLMKTIQLESAIKRLQDENSRLHKKLLKQPHGFHRHINKFSNVSTDDDSSEHHYFKPPRKLDDDKVALLQYTVEKQSEELENLKRQVKGEKGLSKASQQPDTHASHKSSTDNPFLQDTSLEAFLAESKLRFAEIEKKADVMSTSLKEVFKRSSVPTKCHHGESPHSTAKPPSVPKIPANLTKSRQVENHTHSHCKTTRFRVPNFVPAVGNLEAPLKSFLLSQNEDIFTGGIEHSKSAHTKLLTDEKVVIFKGDVNSVDALSQPSPSISVQTSKPAGPKHAKPQNDEDNNGAYPETQQANSRVENLAPSTPKVEVKEFRGVQQLASREKIPSVASPRKPNSQLSSEVGLEPEISPVGFQKLILVNKSDIPPIDELEGKLTEISNKSTSTSLNESSPEHVIKEEMQIETQKTEQKTPPTFSVFPKPQVTRSAVEVNRKTDESKMPSRVIHDLVRLQQTNVPPTLAAASSSGALIQYKVPSPDVSEHEVSIKTGRTVHKKDEGSWGDAVHATGKALERKKSFSSDNSISFPDISHAEGDAMDFMAEEDFWAI